MSNLTPDDVDLRLTATKAELTEEDQRLWLGLEDEKISRIAGDEANKQFTELVKQQNSGTESRLSTEVIHRSEGDVSNLNSLNAVAQALSDYRIKTDLEINNEVIARKALGVELNSRINSFVSTWDHQKYLIYQAIQDVQDDIDGKYASMDTRIVKYEQMLSDITADSIQITTDNGEINMGAWTILSQAREWDLQIIGRMKDFQIRTGEDLNQALEDIQNKLPVEQDIVDRAIEVLSNAPVIKELDDKLTGAIGDINNVNQNLLGEVTNRQNEMIAQAQNTANAIKSQADELTAAILAETAARIDAVTREADIRTLQIEGINSSISEETAERIEEIRLLNNGLTAEVNSRVEGDQNITTALDNYKESNDTALANVRNTVEVLVSDSTAMSQTVSSLDARLTVTEASTATANSLAASANEKATTALTATTSLAERMESVKASIETVQGDLTNKVDVIAFNSLKTEVTAIDGRVTTNTANIASITGNITDISSQLTANTTAISELSTEQTQQGNDIEQVSSQVTKLSADIDSVQDAVANKADASAVASLTTQVNQQGENITLINSDITTLKGSVSTVEGNLASKADVTAFNALDTKVTAVDGRVTTHASSITKLQADVSGNSSKLIVQGDVVDGLKASYVVKTDVNGLVTGYGLYNEGGVGAFGVNADYFYVGRGTTTTGGKKPFMVLTSAQTIGGVTYPAGTWIDVALIANATIGTAHIADASITNAKISSLDAAKITTGTLDAARIKVGAATQYEVGYDPITKARTFVAQPVTPYRIGDIWKNGSTTSICTVTRLTGAYVAADWGKTGDVTSENTADDTSKVGGVAAATVNQNITNAQTAATNAATLAGNKGEVIFGTTQPAADKRLAQNLWIDTTSSANTPKRWNGSAWVAVTDKAATDAKAAADAADSKATAAQTAADSANNQVNAWKFTGTTEIDGGKIRADTVTAVQIDVAELSAISGNLGTLTSTSPQGTTTMTGSLIEVRDSSGQLRVKLGVW